MGFAGLIVVAALAAQGAGEARPPAETPAPAAAAKAEKPKKICVEEPQLGSHFAKRICATAEEWERRRERDAAAMAKAGANRACRGDFC